MILSFVHFIYRIYLGDFKETELIDKLFNDLLNVSSIE